MRRTPSARTYQASPRQSKIRYWIVASVVASLMALGAGVAWAHYQSGYLSGCVYATYTDFHQNTAGGKVYNYLDGKGTISSTSFGHGNVHWRRGGFWGGNEWAVWGDHPEGGTATAHCGG